MYSPPCFLWAYASLNILVLVSILVFEFIFSAFKVQSMFPFLVFEFIFSASEVQSMFPFREGTIMNLLQRGLHHRYLSKEKVAPSVDLSNMYSIKLNLLQ